MCIFGAGVVVAVVGGWGDVGVAVAVAYVADDGVVVVVAVARRDGGELTVA